MYREVAGDLEKWWRSFVFVFYHICDSDWGTTLGHTVLLMLGWNPARWPQRRRQQKGLVRWLDDFRQLYDILYVLIAYFHPAWG